MTLLEVLISEFWTWLCSISLAFQKSYIEDSLLGVAVAVVVLGVAKAPLKLLVTYVTGSEKRDHLGKFSKLSYWYRGMQ